MADWFLETGLYLLGVALIPGVGLLLVCWGLWGDRSKGRARCPKCWYDMRGSLPSLVCPECGHDAKQARRLYRNRRRWWPVVLGVMLVLLLSYPLIIVGGWYREQSAINNLTKRGYAVESQAHIGPTWLIARLPDRFARLFDRASSAGPPQRTGFVPRPNDTDADMAELGKLSQLRLLVVEGPQVTDAGLVHLKGLSQLQILGMSGTQVTDAGLVHLKGLSQLQTLYLFSAQVTDAGLVHLKGLTRLQTLYLNGTQVTDAGLVHLKGLTRLQTHLQHRDVGTAAMTMT